MTDDAKAPLPNDQPRTAIVTGGAQGIGRATTEHLLKKGWRVAAFDKDKTALDEVSSAWPDLPLFAKVCDVGDERQVGDAFAALQRWQADGRAEGMDLLVNNAGIADPVSGPIEQLSLDGWQSWIDASLTAAFLCSRAAVPALRDANGAIVNIASTRAVQSEPDCEAYAAAKGGLIALTHAMAISLGPDIRVNAVLPGWIETSAWQKSSERADPEHSDTAKAQHPVGRIGTPHDIVATIEFLASGDAGFITGQTVTVDGGMTRKMIYTA